MKREINKRLGHRGPDHLHAGAVVGDRRGHGVLRRAPLTPVVVGRGPPASRAAGAVETVPLSTDRIISTAAAMIEADGVAAASARKAPRGDSHGALPLVRQP